ncbi:MAG: heparinase II/III family protein [Verrucomicrobia bacterium]|nr:heparinase II/III family protein [Verrucomicrobiota bacterium]
MATRILTLTLLGAVVIRGEDASWPKVNGLYPVAPQGYKWLTENLYIPTRTTFLSDEAMASKLDLDLPQLAEVKAALEKKDAAALEHALAAHLTSRQRPLAIEKKEKIPCSDSPNLISRPDAWLGTELALDVNGLAKTYPLGADIPWYHDLEGCDGAPAFEGWGVWGNPLGSAYLATGDAKYAQAILTLARSFYQNARPPAQRPKTYFGCSGPWQGLSASGRIQPAYMPWVYRAAAGSPVMTDADRVMFLKMFWEHGDYCHQLLEEHIAHNFEVHIISGLLHAALTFPDFRDANAWRERCIERLTQNMEHAILDDGGSVERTGYHFAYLGPYADHYRRLRDAGHPLSEAFQRKMESMFDWTMWVLSPLKQYPNLGLGGPYDQSGHIRNAAELFPARADFAWLASGGQRGAPPLRTAKVLPQTGFLTMRSDWTTNALFMAMNYNGSPAEEVTHPDLLSFSLWAHGRFYMSNAGTPVSYGDPLYATWCKHTRSSNTVLVDKKNQEQVTNGGRLESWANLPEGAAPSAPSKASTAAEALTEQHPVSLTPYHLRPPGNGFTYVAAVSDAYRKRGVAHRRAVLFVKPRYWLIHDRLDPTGNAADEHEYRWQEHFQPTTLSVEPSGKTVRTSVENGKSLWVISLDAADLSVEEGQGVIATPTGAGDGPYVRFIKKSARPTSFAVLLHPLTGNASPPVVESLDVKQDQRPVPQEEAIGCRVGRGTSVDVLALAAKPGQRQYGPLVTDAEAAYIRFEGDRVVAAGMSGGKFLEHAGRRLIEAGNEISATHVIFTNGAPQVQAEGRGAVVAWRDARPLARWFGRGKARVKFGKPGALTLSNVQISTKPEDILRVIGVPGTWEAKDTLALTWQTAVPADARVEYRKAGDAAWRRTINPERLLDHRFALRQLENGQTYQLRITSRSEEGLPGVVEKIYTHKE